MAQIEIFRPVQGKTSMEGVSVTLTAADLQDMAAAYNPATHEAPLTIGHPVHDAPAYGWVKALSFADGALHADCEQSPELGELVARGRYKKVSASFYTPLAPGNPTPGKWGLRHVGFLGAQPPGIKGLKTVSFADGEAGVVTFGELPAYAGSYIAGLFGKLRDWIIAKDGLDVADRVMPSYEVDNIRSISQRAQETVDADEANEANETDPPSGTPALSFAEPGKAATLSATGSQQEKPPMKTPQQLQAELDASTAELQTLRAAETTRLAAERVAAAAQRHAGHVSFAEGLVAAAKWPGGARDVLVAAMDVLATPGADAGVVSFGEGDAARPLLAVLQQQLQALPPRVSFAEFGKNGGGGALSSGELAARAIAYQEEQAARGVRVNTAEAVAHVLA